MAKGLLIGRNPINNVTGNGKTLAAFFKRFSPIDLSQIYVSNLPINSELCHDSLHINELAVFRSIYKQQDSMCAKTSVDDIRPIQSKESFSQNILKSIGRLPFGLLLRDYLWEKTREKWQPLIESFVQKVKPDFIFYDVGNISTEYRLVTSIVKKFGIPLILYISDDYIYGNHDYSMIARYHKQQLRNSFEDLLRSSSLLIVISDYMKLLYEKHTDVKIITAMNGCEKYSCKPKKITRDRIRVVYTGNVGLGRWATLKKVNKALLLLNQRGICAKLQIYSSFNVTAKRKSDIEKCRITEFKGAVFGDDLRAVWENADVLLHIESFKHKYRSILETAISTKIPEYMCSRRPILIVAPQYAGSARIIDNNCAGTVVSSFEENDIANALETIVLNRNNKISNMVENAYDIACKDYTIEAVSNRVYKEIISVVKLSKGTIDS